MRVSIEADLNTLEREITALKIDYERFFQGELRQPPLVPRRKIEESLRRLGDVEVDRAADRFRLQSVQSRYNALRELWEKRLQAREEGRGVFAQIAHLDDPKRRPAAAAKKGAEEAEPAGSVIFSGITPAVGSPQLPGDVSPPGSVRPKGKVDFSPLFERYAAARRALGEDVSKLKYERFEEQVRKQAEELRRRFGVSRLLFEVQTVDGRVKLIGRPAPAKGKA